MNSPKASGARVAKKTSQTPRRNWSTWSRLQFDGRASGVDVHAQHRLLGDISHELRSPSHVWEVALGLARQRSGGEAISALDRIERESENLNEMIRQLLILTRLESGTDGRKKTDVDLAFSPSREVADDADFEARSINRAVQVTGTDSCSHLRC